MLRICIRDPESGAFLTPGSEIRDLGWVKSQDLGSGMNNEYIFYRLETIFWVKGSVK